MYSFDFLLITFILTILYSLITILFHTGLSREYPVHDRNLSVSILVAARNEEKYLPACLESLSRLDYNRELLEIIIINDQSQDSTKEIAEQYQQKYDHFKLLNIENNIDGLKGKMNALSQALDICKSEIIMITDADCIVPETWVKETVKYFEVDVGMCGGMTYLSGSGEKESFFTKVQSMDLFYMLGVASANAGIGKPVTVLGNNFAFRKKVYDELGGFRKIGYSITEDYRLLKAIKKQTDWKIIYPLQPENSIYSHPLLSFGDFLNQRKRWLRGGKDCGIWAYFLMLTSMLTRICVVLNLFISDFSFLSWIFLLVVLLMDYSLPGRLIPRFNKTYLNKYFPVFEFFYLFYSIILTIVFIFRRDISWKGRKL